MSPASDQSQGGREELTITNNFSNSGLSIGGHCISHNPYYMSYQAKKHSSIPRFIETSGEDNEFMKMQTINLVQQGFKRVGMRLFLAKVAVLALAYKKNINDPRESPAIEIIEELVSLGARVRVCDPFVPSIMTGAGLCSSTADNGEPLAGADCAVFLVDHDRFRAIPYGRFAEVMASPVVVDGENLFCGGEGIVYLGIEKGGNHVQ